MSHHIVVIFLSPFVSPCYKIYLTLPRNQIYCTTSSQCQTAEATIRPILQRCRPRCPSKCLCLHHGAHANKDRFAAIAAQTSCIICPLDRPFACTYNVVTTVSTFSLKGLTYSRQTCNGDSAATNNAYKLRQHADLIVTFTPSCRI